ncbi:hypothetical protein Lalb_Chr22g0360231 [Lupinus albus]|uniref:Uncharacterized protein n=1 Tax=Lupinus albus TaxID=3870 RepID=A0A6A4N2U6_LUPAL|nr:hypothetical protein Lalb_Chr22g0360231 [Lupinus albus]
MFFYATFSFPHVNVLIFSNFLPHTPDSCGLTFSEIISLSRIFFKLHGSFFLFVFISYTLYDPCFSFSYSLCIPHILSHTL